MQKIKQFIIISVIIFSLFFLFGLEVIPDNFQLQEVLEAAKNSDVIIIFNSGGWGNTPLQEAEDFVPIVEGIEKTLSGWGYNSLVIPYTRTKDDLSGKITGAKDFLNSFQTSSEILAEKVNFLTESLPDKKIIMAGLSAGGALVNKTMEKISEKSQVFAIEAGVPFWHEKFESENVLQLNNDGKDSLSVGEIKTLLFSLAKAPLKWILAKMNGEDLTFSQAIRAPGHEYFWDSPEVGPQIVSFLKNRFK